VVLVDSFDFEAEILVDAHLVYYPIPLLAVVVHEDQSVLAFYDLLEVLLINLAH
jgi:hypothetical protein